MSRAIAWLTVLLAALAWADDEATRRAREELERELNHLVERQPARVRLDFEALDEPNLALEEVQFELDGRALKVPTVSELAREGSHALWAGDVTPGRHTVRARVVYANSTSALLTDEGGHRWKTLGDVSFEVQSGLEVQVRVVPQRDASQRDVSKRLRLSLPARPVMLAKVDDSVPEAPSKRVEAAAPARADAGSAQVVVAKGPEAVVRAPPPPREPPTPEVTSRPPRESSREPAPREPAPREPSLAQGRAMPEEAPVVDAGASTAAAVALAPAPDAESRKPTQPADSSGEFNGFLWAGGAALALTIGLILLARRKARPPQL